MLGFHADPAGDSGLYVMNADGTGVRLVAEALSGHPFAQWSPEGDRLAYLAGSYGFGVLRVVNVDGTGDEELTGETVTAPDWSPDGKSLVYESVENGLWVIAIDGTARQITESGHGPVWSPDGALLAYFDGSDGANDIFVVPVAGGEATPLAEDPADDVSPEWSPDGSKLAFVSQRDGNSELYLVGPDGSDLRRLTNDPAPDEAFAWHPDGERIAYVSYRDGADPLSLGIGNAEVYVVEIDSGVAVNLSQNPAWDGDAEWSPDGEWLAFTRRTDHGEIYLMRPDGSNQLRLDGLARPPLNDCCATWRPTRDG